MEPVEVSAFPPDPECAKRLMDGSVITDGDGAPGYSWADIKWNPQRGCLCIETRNKEGKWSVRTEIRDDSGQPRQVNMADVQECLDSAYGRRDMVDNWLKNWQQRRTDMMSELKSHMRDVIHDTVKEMVRVGNHGFRQYHFMSDIQAATETNRQQGALKAIDRRRVT